MSTVTSRLLEIREHIPAGVTLVAVSKFHPVEALREAYEAGQRDFGESRAQELSAKAPEMPADVRWHFIGHLQTNKVRQVMPHVSLIHSIDSLRLLCAVNAEAARIGRVADVLLQVHVAREETKFGFTPAELSAIAAEWKPDDTPHVRVRGLMGMASLTDDTTRISADFSAVAKAYNELKSGLFAGQPSFDTLSMGMSDDFPLAIAAGSTMVRIGTDIFGAREY
ncbi:YggS family pyridoxal phosphate-dependent enzyme [uncultured Muribaculum sp.]|uniref:YggS family pyridoxal phosphate-dependent enzyme n=1 Tax=uncultured Muribaculum sp. TaxID=1918613 RepID=UPI0025CE3350|nr:YggS family pyridoxal phosphate-dependent enzyme [uncultured Muribaculum sp.]